MKLVQRIISRMVPKGRRPFFREFSDFSESQKRVVLWMREYCKVGNGLESRPSELYDSFKIWSELEERGLLSKRSFLRTLKDMGTETIHRRDGVHFKGIAIRSLPPANQVG